MTVLEIARAPSAQFSGIAAKRIAATNDVAGRFFRLQADAIAHACQGMALAFEKGGRLLVCGDHAQTSDVSHVVVEFLHPVVVGKRALPVIALPDIASGGALRALPVIGRPHDMLMVLASGSLSVPARELIAAAEIIDLTTIALTGATAETPAAQYAFSVPSDDACIVQETHEMLYHVLWELVHVFFDHRARTP